MPEREYADTSAVRAVLPGRRSETSAKTSKEAAPSATAAEVPLHRMQRQFGNRYAREAVQGARQPSLGVHPTVERSIESARGGGQALDPAVRQHMEPSFGADFHDVRIHTDCRADTLSRALDARAFTTGRDIFFRDHAYRPGTSSGNELLAHELTHVVQQGGSVVHRQASVSQPGEPQELEAEQMARAVVGHEAKPAQDAMPVQAKADASALQRQPEAPKKDDEEEKKKLHAKLDGEALRKDEKEPRP